MIPEQKAAYINAKIASMLTEMHAMLAANTERIIRNESMAYKEEDFRALPEKYSLGENDLVVYCFREE